MICEKNCWLLLRDFTKLTLLTLVLFNLLIDFFVSYVPKTVCMFRTYLRTFLFDNTTFRLSRITTT